MNITKLNGVKKYENRDSRDYTISKFIPTVDIIADEEYCLQLPKLNFILNQKSYNSCVGHSFALCKSLLEYQRTGKWIDIDPYLIYGTRYKDEYDGVGMYSWQGAKVLRNEGAYLRRDFNIQSEVPELLDIVNRWKESNPKLVDKAKDFKIDAWYYVYNSQEIKQSLKSNIPISVAYPIYDTFYNTGVEGIVTLPDKQDTFIGYHQMTIVGWTKDNNWIVINSWGNEFGFKGVYLIPFEYEFDSAIAVTDSISPLKSKAKHITLSINSQEIKVDGLINYMEIAPFIKNNRTYVPIRFISEFLGASVEWISNKKIAIIRSEENVITLQANNKKVITSNKTLYCDSAPLIVKDRLMVPIRFVADCLNCSIIWNGISSKIDIISK